MARLVLAAVETVSIAANFQAIGITAFDAGNYFCFFTVQSAVGAVALLGTSGVLAITGRPESSRIHAARSIVLGYVILAGIVYGILAVGSAGEVKPIIVTPSDVVLHFIMPVLLTIDFIAERRLAMRTNTLPWLTMGWALPYPGVWLVFTMVRGSIVGWFPYFFIDPTRTKSPVEMGVYIMIVILMILVLTTGSVALTRIGAHTLFAPAPVLGAPVPRIVYGMPHGDPGSAHGRFRPASALLAPASTAVLRSQLAALSGESRWTSSVSYAPLPVALGTAGHGDRRWVDATAIPRSRSHSGLRLGADARIAPRAGRCDVHSQLQNVGTTAYHGPKPRPPDQHTAVQLSASTPLAGKERSDRRTSSVRHSGALHAGALHAGTLHARSGHAGTLLSPTPARVAVGV
ncbi:MULTISPECIES: Pr6Pr family membrane protein [unclassified Leifsonia]|uniref:Pr6Pr family membrane protein n=1 Tax=unclassified Leifsonia TaxID=2663824 RepID=UPI0012FC13AC|nr:MULTISPECIES: Pr6Pr family membrane protein [unclassified Leifsonia]